MAEPVSIFDQRDGNPRQGMGAKCTPIGKPCHERGVSQRILDKGWGVTIAKNVMQRNLDVSWTVESPTGDGEAALPVAL